MAIKLMSIQSSSKHFFSRLFALLPPTRRCFNVLAIESSADDTCAAVVNSSRKILSNVVIKQNDIHKGYGGIHALLAIHEHMRSMPFAVKRALTEAGVDLIRDIDGIAFTRGPGTLPSSPLVLILISFHVRDAWLSGRWMQCCKDAGHCAR